VDGGVEERGREAKEDEAVDRLDRAQEPPAVIEKDRRVTVAGDRAERIEHRVPPVRQGAEPEIETRPGRRFEPEIDRADERRERDEAG
jgi:hypothetical protein